MSSTTETTPVYNSKEKVRDLMPESRYPYAVARYALEAEGMSRNLLTGKAIVCLAGAQERGILEPLLSPELEHAVFATSQILDPDGTPKFGLNDWHPDIVRGILEAVFEHGYRSA